MEAIKLYEDIKKHFQEDVVELIKDNHGVEKIYVRCMSLDNNDCIFIGNCHAGHFNVEIERSKNPNDIDLTITFEKNE